MKDNLAKLYSCFTPEERIQLTVAAIVRNDFDEVDKLRQTCPKKLYRATDAAYTDKMEALKAIGSHFQQLCSYFQHKIFACEAYLMAKQLAEYAYQEGFERGYEAAKSGKLNDEKDISCVLKGFSGYLQQEDAMQEARAQYQASYSAAVEAIKAFCMKAGLNTKHVSAWFKSDTDDSSPAVNTSNMCNVELYELLIEEYFRIYT